jgi:prepilin-type N-terminal cleavage/methylation domain-containing protein
MLARLRKSMDEKDEGFTLIELLVVIIIIGILAAIAIPIFLNQRKKAVDASMKSDVKTVATAEETWFVDAQAYVAVAATTTSAAIGSTSNTAALSPGNTITVTVGTANPQAYCVLAHNANGTQDWVYVNTQGGLQPNTVTSCPSL